MKVLSQQIVKPGLRVLFAITVLMLSASVNGATADRVKQGAVRTVSSPDKNLSLIHI